MTTVFVYGNGVLLSEDKVSEISGKVVNVLKTELPREAQCTEVIESILTDVKNSIHKKKLEL